MTGASSLYFECPAVYEPAAGDPPVVFVAGGVVGVEDWQTAAAEVLTGYGAIVLNPRRAHFPIGDPEQTPVQIRWEHRHLHLPGVLTMFWFPACDAAVTTQPIAMFELGAALGEQRPLVVGADPSYPRVEDVRWQVELARPGTPVHASLADTLEATRHLIQQETP